MFESLAKFLKKPAADDVAEKPAARKSHDIPVDCAQIYESLAMTDELKEALFPTQTRMVSAIFDRPLSSRPPQTPGSGGGAGGFPVI